jgi:hypothetical protein
MAFVVGCRDIVVSWIIMFLILVVGFFFAGLMMTRCLTAHACEECVLGHFVFRCLRFSLSTFKVIQTCVSVVFYEFYIGCMEEHQQVIGGAKDGEFRVL